MPRLTSEQLQAARHKKVKEEAKQRMAEERKQREEEAAREAELAPLRERLAKIRALAGKKEQLKSVLKGYYDEMDKLSKKAPADQVTELALRRTNDLIRQCKELLQGDSFIDSIDLFVAAGERPEHRDVLLVLRDLMQGIERYEKEARDLSERLSPRDETGSFRIDTSLLDALHSR